MDRLDAKYEAFAEIVSMPRKPSEYIRENFYFVAEPREQTVDEVKRILGEDRVLWGSDYPHVDAGGDGEGPVSCGPPGKIALGTGGGGGVNGTGLQPTRTSGPAPGRPGAGRGFAWFH